MLQTVYLHKALKNSKGFPGLR